MARRYEIVEVDGRRHNDSQGSYWRVRVSGPGLGYGHWDLYDPDADKLLCIDAPRYLLDEVKRKIEAARVGTEGSNAHP